MCCVGDGPGVVTQAMRSSRMSVATGEGSSFASRPQGSLSEAQSLCGFLRVVFQDACFVTGRFRVSIGSMKRSVTRLVVVGSGCRQ
jgi:hypothetical protein